MARDSQTFGIMKHLPLKRLSSLVALLLFSTFALSAQAPAEHQPLPTEELHSEENGEGDLVESIKHGDQAEVEKLLLAGANPDQLDDEGGLPLCWAVRTNRSDIVELLIAKGADVNKGEDDDTAALDVAAAFGHAEMVKLLLARGAIVDHKDHGGHTPLIAAAMGATIRDMPPFLLAQMWGEGTETDKRLLANLGKEYQAVTELLIKAGADVNLQADDCGMTALMVAAMGGGVDLVQTLLNHGAKASLKRKSDDRDALKFAEAFDSPSVINDLIQDEDEEAKQAYLIWAQITATGRRQVAMMLRAAGARS